MSLKDWASFFTGKTEANKQRQVDEHMRQKEAQLRATNIELITAATRICQITDPLIRKKRGNESGG